MSFASSGSIEERLKANALSTIEASGIQEAMLYLQVTRGAQLARTHTFPTTAVKPTEFLYVTPFDDTNAEKRKTGCVAMTYPDIRWGRCDIKSINLLGNVFAAQAAKEAGMYEAVLSHGGWNSHRGLAHFSFRGGQRKAENTPNSHAPFFPASLASWCSVSRRSYRFPSKKEP